MTGLAEAAIFSVPCRFANRDEGAGDFPNARAVHVGHMTQVEEQAQVSSVEEFANSHLGGAISRVPRHVALDVEHHNIADQAFPYGHDRVQQVIS